MSSGSRGFCVTHQTSRPAQGKHIGPFLQGGYNKTFFSFPPSLSLSFSLFLSLSLTLLSLPFSVSPGKGIVKHNTIIYGSKGMNSDEESGRGVGRKQG